MAFKMSQEFPTISLDIAEEFHILHSIPSSKQKHITGSLTDTHIHAHACNSNNYKQKVTGHVTSLANGHFTGSDAPYMCEILTASSNERR